MRFGLSGEAGLNDGVAFPFVLLGLLLMQHTTGIGQSLGGWPATACYGRYRRACSVVTGWTEALPTDAVPAHP